MVTILQLVNESKGEVIAERVDLADSFLSRFRGLMFKRKFSENRALLFPFSEPKRYSVHTFFMFFPIDLLYLDRELKVTEFHERLPPWRTHRSAEPANFLVELLGGRIEEVGIDVGDRLSLRE